MTRPMRIAICCHSVNPRGGVAHGLALGEALAALGHDPCVFAPDPEGRGFFRTARCETFAFPARPVPRGDVAALVAARVGDYVAALDEKTLARFDLFHAQDGISGNALATLKDRGALPKFARTVHHVDDFRDPRVSALQHRAIVAADAHFVVSRLWRDQFRLRDGLEAAIVGNGVDRARFSPAPDGREAALRVRLGLTGTPVVLSVGGVEPRKNTVRLLGAFAQLRKLLPGAQLVVAGGATLLDHGATAREFEAALASTGLPPDAVRAVGALPDADMPALYRIADVLAFPSVTEGFGLAALEALASGLPAVVSSIAPFTDYLAPDDAAFCDPLSEASIANALVAALSEPLRSRLAERGPQVAERFDWRRVAEAHLPTYRRLSAEPAYA
ncbi:MSMEG_0565 family glycosyltransferase [Chelatococcus sambhunathii]|uniref:MSMEG_0565 family glycosyltransferase n=1 Tax=Chelatococcus sambhunathii TaxID=363953 RepID=A0ABU1DE20_9HYPH|nr:MSMEG_0565 family glycosyltransferase [Chelatococcus sambhunathii]MDR4306363.1 MSMEG_0565 family glycosyltransferase [Chelatococcus sambhunathii]